MSELLLRRNAQFHVKQPDAIHYVEKKKIDEVWN